MNEPHTADVLAAWYAKHCENDERPTYVVNVTYTKDGKMKRRRECRTCGVKYSTFQSGIDGVERRES